MSDLMHQWNKVTAELPWGVHDTLKTALELVGEEEVKMVWGADYHGDHACLINTVGQMLSVGGGHGIPSMYFGPLVSLFDQINRDLRSKQVNTDWHVSPLAAEVLLRYYGPARPRPKEELTSAQIEQEAKDFQVIATGILADDLSDSNT